MKAISLWQPWASLIVEGTKSIETRSWYTGYRGPLLIHAAKRKITRDSWEQDILRFLKNPEMEIPYGALVGRVQLVDCKRTEYIRDGISETEYTLGNFGNDRFGWVMEKPELFHMPIPYKGMQGLFDVHEDDLVMISTSH